MTAFDVSKLGPESRLDRKQVAAALTALGYPVAHASLETMATRGGGPAFRKFGSRVQYQWRDAIEWAEARTSKPVRSTSELAAVA